VTTPQSGEPGMWIELVNRVVCYGVSGTMQTCSPIDSIAIAHATISCIMAEPINRGSTSYCRVLRGCDALFPFAGIFDANAKGGHYVVTRNAWYCTYKSGSLIDLQ